ncbi:hypothetical protein BCRE_1524 [Candidatus Burkholderia crenata]|nr:hypothetical protein BCRE_1524 [Candidatus Burkholderia crenata]
MTLVIYLLGWLILIGSVSWALVAMHVSQHTIMIVDVILLDIAVITGATRAQPRPVIRPSSERRAHPPSACWRRADRLRTARAY